MKKQNTPDELKRFSDPGPKEGDDTATETVDNGGGDDSEEAEDE